MIAKTINAGGIAAISSGVAYDPMKYNSSVSEAMLNNPKIKDVLLGIWLNLKDEASNIKSSVATWTMKYITEDYISNWG